jgi:hypothetical protein
MANVPTREECERFILDVYKRKGARAGDMLHWGIFEASREEQNRFREEDMTSGLESLKEKDMIKQAGNKYSLTETGFEAM